MFIQAGNISLGPSPMGEQEAFPSPEGSQSFQSFLAEVTGESSSPMASFHKNKGLRGQVSKEKMGGEGLDQESSSRESLSTETFPGNLVGGLWPPQQIMEPPLRSPEVESLKGLSQELENLAGLEALAQGQGEGLKAPLSLNLSEPSNKTLGKKIISTMKPLERPSEVLLNGVNRGDKGSLSPLAFKPKLLQVYPSQGLGSIKDKGRGLKSLKSLRQDSFPQTSLKTSEGFFPNQKGLGLQGLDSAQTLSPVQDSLTGEPSMGPIPSSGPKTQRDFQGPVAQKGKSLGGVEKDKAFGREIKENSLLAPSSPGPLPEALVEESSLNESMAALPVMDSAGLQAKGGEALGLESLGQVQKAEVGEKVENLPSIIKQARAFINGGGGEMEIRLEPEGLGKLHLKVAVEKGVVTVDMTADNLLAKQSLEERLLDIKTALQDQKLLVDHLKVEMSPDYERDFSQFQDHGREETSQHLADQFFKQEGQGQEGGLPWEPEEITASPSESQPPSKERSQESEGSLPSNAYTVVGKGQSVNWVA